CDDKESSGKHRGNKSDYSSGVSRFAAGGSRILHHHLLLRQILIHKCPPIASHPSHTETPDYSTPNRPSHDSSHSPDNSCKNSPRTSTTPRASLAPLPQPARADSP